MPHILVVVLRLKLVAPHAEQLLDVAGRLFDGRRPFVAGLCLSRPGGALAALGVSLGRILRLQRLLRVDGVQVFRAKGEGHDIPAEVGIRVEGKTATSGDIHTLLVGGDTQEPGVVGHRLLQHRIEELQHGDVVVIHSTVGAQHPESPAAHGDILHEGMLVSPHQLD